MVIDLYRHWLGTLSSVARRLTRAPRTRETSALRRKSRAAFGQAIEHLDQRIVPTNVTSTIAGAQDLIFDQGRQILYIPTSSGNVERFSLSSQSLLTPLAVGSNLGGGDITADGKYLYVTDEQRAGDQALIHKIDLDSERITDIVVDSNGGNRGAFDLNIASNGIAFVTMRSDNSGVSLPLYQLDLATDTITARADDPVGPGFGGAVTRDTEITRSANRQVMFFTEGDISSGPMFVYSAATDSFPASSGTGKIQDGVPRAVNRNGTLIAERGTVYNASLQIVKVLPAQLAAGAVAFDPIRDMIYVVDSDTDELVVFDTDTWNELYREPLGLDAGVNGRLAIADDGNHAFFQQGDKTRSLDIQHVPVLSVTDLSVAEGNDAVSTANVVIQLSLPSTQKVTVNYVTSNASATGNSDYVSSTGSITFLPGTTTQTIAIQILGDVVRESDEVFHVTISTPHNAILGDVDGTVTLLNDDTGAPSTLTGLEPSVTYLENDVNAAPQIIDSDVMFGAPDVPSFQGGNLNAAVTAGKTTDDQLSVRDQGTGVGQVGVIGNTLTVGGQAFATFTNSNGVLNVQFTSSRATPAVVQSLIENLTFRNQSNTPAASRTISIVVSDNFGTSSLPATSEIIITPQSDTPTITNLSNSSVTAGGSLTVDFTIGDDQTLPENLVVTATSSNPTLLPNGNLTLGGAGTDRTLKMTPVAGKSGVSTITVTVNDGGLQSVQVFQLSVIPVTSTPIITNIQHDQSTDEDTQSDPISFTVADLDTPLTNLTVTGTSSNLALVAQSGIAISGTGATRTVRITPLANQMGTSTITLKVTDGSTSSTETFVITVNPVNDAPTITPTTDRTTNEDIRTSAIAFSIGDIDSPLSGLTVTAVSSNQRVPDANLLLAGVGTLRTVTAVPLANMSGVTTITLTVSDGTATVSDSFTVTVVSVDDPPTLTPISLQTINEDSATQPLNFTIADIDTPLSGLTVTATSSDPTLVPNDHVVLTGTGADRTITITPLANAFGTTKITLAVSDGTTTVVNTFDVVVFSVDDAPTISAIDGQLINEDGMTASIPFTIADLETAASALKVTVSSSNPALVPNGNLVLGGADADRTLTAKPSPNASGSTDITVSVSDGILTRSSTFTLTVSAVNDAPTLSAIPNQTTNEDTATATLPFTIGDLETLPDGLTITASSSNQDLIPDGNLSLTGTGAVRAIKATPAANQSGTAIITLNVSDGAITVTKTFVVTVVPVNDAPTMNAIADQVTSEDLPSDTVPILLSDIDTDAAQLTLTATSSNSALVPNSNITLGGSGAQRTILLTPVANQSGTTTITLTSSDGTAIVTKTFVLTVIPVNDPPTILGLFNVSIPEDTVSPPLFFKVGDLESSSENLSVTAQSSNPALIPSESINFVGTGSERSLQLTPLANQFGSSTITVSVRDGESVSSTSFVLSVTSVNDVPTISSIPSQTMNENQQSSVVPFAISDLETPTANLTITATSTNPLLVPVASVVFEGTGANRALTITPATGHSGLSIVTITISDGQDTRSSSFPVIVNAVNNAPTFTLGTIADQTGSAAPVMLPHWLSGISPGGDEEASQTLQFNVTMSNPSLFLAAPVINARGDLTYTLVPNASGQTAVTVTCHDNGGTANGGRDTSVPQTFIISATDDPLTTSEAGDPRVFVIGDAPTPIDPQLEVADADDPRLNFSNGQLLVTIADGTFKNDVLSLPVTKRGRQPEGDIALVGHNVLYRNQSIGAVTGGKKGVPLSIQFAGGASADAVNALLKALTFTTRGKQTVPATRTIRLELQGAGNVEHAVITREIDVVRTTTVTPPAPATSSGHHATTPHSAAAAARKLAKHAH